MTPEWFQITREANGRCYNVARYRTLEGAKAHVDREATVSLVWSDTADGGSTARIRRTRYAITRVRS